jgi:hypothetical protein
VTALQEESQPVILRPSFLREYIQKFSTANFDRFFESGPWVC